MSIAPPGPESQIYSPAELNKAVRLHLEGGFPRLWIQAELSNLARPASGHLYFTLKDARAQIRCALFRGNASGLGFRPENGQQVLVRGRLSLYEPRGDYQLIADAMLEAGAGALQQAFEALKKKLEAEGLFAPEGKQPIPEWPRRISVITSPSGAAIRDILKVLGQRWPSAQVRIYPAQVQGDSAPAELVRALVAADRQRFGDVIIIGRGGGSLEDLWAFNDEQLARTMAACATPIISAVGHETDFTIADFVADLRAPTPTAAAMAATPDGPALRLRLVRLDQQLMRAIQGQLDRQAQTIDHLGRRLAAHHPGRRLAEFDERARRLGRRAEVAIGQTVTLRLQRLKTLEQRLLTRHPSDPLKRLDQTLSRLDDQLTRAVQRRIDQSSERLGALLRALNAVSPLQVLERGYAVVRDADGNPLTARDQFIKSRKINILMKDFEVDTEIVSGPRDAQLK
jgi:exodeoxyribonuclease VII large subunit